ncbi:amidase [Peribacillus frigoritolerans]|uniref:amidase n=1 Tax=Peribacillus frigoritolerans TaxID=450367 RepID=UPI002E24B2AB|nr:amidase [Peribacillus frigoritolerans]
MILTIKELMEGYKHKLFSPTEITKWYMERIKKLNPKMHSYITVTEEKAFYQAKKAEMMINSGEVRRGLLGVPISYKDSIDTEGILTTSGSIIDEKRIPTENAEVVTMLEREGSILLGKNNMYEFAFGITSQNPFFGDVINPWNKNKTAGGSSGGSAAAIAANLCLGSIGTDTAGSIRVPAACCGVVGLKPTYNLVSMKGMTPLSWTLDHAGPIAGNIEDTAIIMQTLTGIPYTTTGLNGLSGMRIGLPTHYFNENMDDEVKKMYEKAVQHMIDLGATIVEVDTSFLSDVVSIATTLGTSEVGVVHKERIQSAIHLYSKGAQKTFEKSRLISAYDYLNALQKRAEWTRRVSEIFLDVDVMITPAMPIATADLQTEEVNIGGQNESLGDCMIRYTSLFNITGHPALSIPFGLTEPGVPLGLQLIANHNREDLLFRAGYAYEQYVLTSFYSERHLKMQ